MRTISGAEARAVVEGQLAAHGNGVLSVLAQYRRDDAVAAWHETIRAVEEFINLPKFGIADDRLRTWLCAVRLGDAFVSNPGPTWLAVRHALAPHLEAPVISRFTRVMLYAGAMGAAFAQHGLDARSASITLDTIGGAVDYFQSRRRHFVSLLYTMPYACSGSLILQPYDALTVLMPQVEHSCIAITGFHQKLALLEALPDFSLEVDHIGAMASHGFETLDDYFLEPERASIHVMSELRGEKIDIVDYSDDPATFVANALSPAHVSSVTVLDPTARSARVVVPDYQLSLAIGKEGQNARLAARLTGWRIDIRPDTEADLGAVESPGTQLEAR
jgi:hypothetical protein